MALVPETLSLGGTSPEKRRGRAQMLFVAFEGSRPLAGSTRHSLLGVDEVTLGRGAERGWNRVVINGKRTLQLTIPDSWMSGRHARLVVDGERVSAEDLGSKNGTLVGGEAITRERPLSSGDILEIGSTFLCYMVVDDCDVQDAMLLDAMPPEEPHGMSSLLPSLRVQTSQLKKIARASVSVIVHGESGTGKELIARAIHALSGRSGPFVAVNCASITDSLLESELFGHKRGAFSGAIADRRGLVESSSGGTLFLDEIGELSPKGQASLLRVLEQEEVMPVGANRPVSVDLRVVAATHRALLTDVENGGFREDLYARLSTFVATVPPLRERKAELGSIIASLFVRTGDGATLCFAPKAARALLHYDWPRNVRELEKCLASAVVLSGERIELEHLSDLVKRPVSSSSSRLNLGSEDTLLRAQLIELLTLHKGNVTQVGTAMGKKRQQIQKWCKRLEIDPKRYR